MNRFEDIFQMKYHTCIRYSHMHSIFTAQLISWGNIEDFVSSFPAFLMQTESFIQGILVIWFDHSFLCSFFRSILLFLNNCYDTWVYIQFKWNLWAWWTIIKIEIHRIWIIGAFHLKLTNTYCFIKKIGICEHTDYKWYGLWRR